MLKLVSTADGAKNVAISMIVAATMAVLLSFAFDYVFEWNQNRRYGDFRPPAPSFEDSVSSSDKKSVLASMERQTKVAIQYHKQREIQTLQNLANVYQKAGDTDRVKNIEHRIERALVGHPVQSDILYGLALSSFHRGALWKTEQHLIKAIEALAEDMNWQWVEDLTTVQSELNKPETARKRLKALIPRAKKEKGEHSVELANLYDQIAWMLNMQFRFDEALKANRRSFEVAELAKNVDDRSRSSWIMTAGVIEAGNGNFEAALEQFETSLAMAEPVLPKGHFRFAWNHAWLAYVHKQLGNQKSASQSKKTAIRLFQDTPREVQFFAEDIMERGHVAHRDRHKGAP